MYRRILVPIDGSHTATLGLQQAVQLAKNQHARLRIIHIIDESVITKDFGGYVDASGLMDMLEESGKAIIKNGLALAQRHGINAEKATYETLGQRVSDIIVGEAKKWKADLIVLGTHGRRGINRLVLGSDAETILRTSPVPVLMVRGKPVAKTATKKTGRHK